MVKVCHWHAALSKKESYRRYTLASMQILPCLLGFLPYPDSAGILLGKARLLDYLALEVLQTSCLSLSYKI